jgi:hypothetical protein
MRARDYSGMFSADGVCVICHQPRTIAGYDVHSEIHLMWGDAIVEGQSKPSGWTERVIPTPNNPRKHALLKPRPMDPALRKLVRAHLKKVSTP